MRLIIPITVASLLSTVFAVTSPPETIELVGTVRDFKERTAPGGHPDFERQPSRGFAQYCKNISEQLGNDGKPVFTGNGRKVKYQCSDSDWNPICWTMYDSTLGDHNIVFRKPSTGGIQSESTFNQWYNDVEGVNISIPISITLVLQEDGSYVFDDSDDPLYQSLGGFFPIEGQGFGNPGGSPDRNFHFTFELHTEFTYDEDGAQFFSFLGDDDVWVFINGQLVIDLGGVHGAIAQGVDLTRLDLIDGETYALDFFFAERHRTQSNFRFQTNLELETASLPTGEDSYD